MVHFYQNTESQPQGYYYCNIVETYLNLAVTTLKLETISWEWCPLSTSCRPNCQKERTASTGQMGWNVRLMCTTITAPKGSHLFLFSLMGRHVGLVWESVLLPALMYYQTSHSPAHKKRLPIKKATKPKQHAAHSITRLKFWTKLHVYPANAQQ